MNRIVTGVLLLLMLFMTGCETDSNNQDPNLGITVNTEDIGQTGYFFNLDNGSFTSSWDLKFELVNQTYLIALNNTAGVYGMLADTNDFAIAELPSAPFRSDSTADNDYLIGGNWMDMDTYNPSDHSIQGNGQIYFIRTVDYEIVKLEILSGSPTEFSFVYSVDENGFTSPDTVVIPYGSGQPALFDFTAAEVIDETAWDIGLLTQPVYAPDMGNMYMPTVHLNYDRAVMVAVLPESDFESIIEVPADIEWNADTSSARMLGYGGTYEILVYHPEPPYNHKVIVENPDYVYLVNSPDGIFKLQFEEYGDGAIVFVYDKL